MLQNRHLAFTERTWLSATSDGHATATAGSGAPVAALLCVPLAHLPQLQKKKTTTTSKPGKQEGKEPVSLPPMVGREQAVGLARR